MFWFGQWSVSSSRGFYCSGDSVKGFEVVEFDILILFFELYFWFFLQDANFTFVFLVNVIQNIFINRNILSSKTVLF